MSWGWEVSDFGGFFIRMGKGEGERGEWGWEDGVLLSNK